MNTAVMEKEFIHTNLGVNREGHLTFAGADTVELAEKYGTALMVIDEARIRSNMRTYIDSMKKYFGEGSVPLFASKSLCFKELYRIAAAEGMCTDIVSPGELYLADSAAFPMSRAYFHGNNKTDDDIRFALRCGIGYFIVDNADELSRLDEIAGIGGVRQKILLRLTPGIDPHTHAKISTGKVDSKFGVAIETGQAEELVRYALTLKNVELVGFHSHIGSQIFDIDPFCDAADILLAFIAKLSRDFGYVPEMLNLGGGFGVRYVASDPEIDIADCIRRLADEVRSKCSTLGIPMPKILLEPGRSIVADAGITLYTVGSVKTITGYKSYVSVDGGMTDNPRYALYQSAYTVVCASHADRAADFCCTVAGRCCESGDLLQEDVMIARPERGDILAVLVTGAYNYSMASNYNKIPRPAIVMVKDGVPRVVVHRETFEHMASLDV